MSDYYNDSDAYCCRWLQNLIAAGELPTGCVDEREIQHVQPEELETYTHCHFFSGIGGWAYALRLAGWPEGEEVWTGSCPCQPFSCAGRGRAEEDERHLWPAFRRLISVRRPATVFGEQVASKAGREWLAGVRADLEDMGYRVGAADLPACSVGEEVVYVEEDAPCRGCGKTWDWCECVLPGPFEGEVSVNEGPPHIRSRLFWVADADHKRSECRPGQGPHIRASQDGERADDDAGRRGAAGRLDDSTGARYLAEGGGKPEQSERGECLSSMGCESGGQYLWLPCADGKARRIESGLEPLADGLSRNMGWHGPGDNPHRQGPPSRVGMLRGYGNAIVPQLAAEFIAAYMEAR